MCFILVEDVGRSAVFTFKEVQEFSASVWTLPHCPPHCHCVTIFLGPFLICKMCEVVSGCDNNNCRARYYTSYFYMNVLSPCHASIYLHFMNNNNSAY